MFWQPSCGSTAGWPRHTTETNHMVLYKIKRNLFTTARGKGRLHSRQQHSYSCSHPTPMGTREPTPVSETRMLRDQECPAHVALPKQPEAQDGCEVPAVLPSGGTLFLTSCPITTLSGPRQPPGHCCSAGTAPKHSQALPSWAPNYGETSGIPFQLFPGERGRAPSALFSSTAQLRTGSSSFSSMRERSCLVPKPP